MSANFEYFKTLNLTPYRGEYIAIVNCKLVSHNSDLKEAMAIARSVPGGDVPFKLFVPENDYAIL
jgi:hypothetical protein